MEKGEKLTICIGALCENSKMVVIASDRMITATYPPIEFEHGIPKLEIICPTCIVLTAGDALAHADLCRDVRGKVSILSHPLIGVITEEVRKTYANQRLKVISERYIEPRGWNIKDFYGKYIGVLPPPLAIAIDQQIINYDYGLEAIVAGADPEEAHIYGVRHPGEVDCYDSLGYHAIGIGAMHAISSLVANSYLPTVDINLATYQVYEAKRNAESAPGVGKDTDMAIITNKNYKIVANEQISTLQEIYNSRLSQYSEDFNKTIAGLTFKKEVKINDKPQKQ